MLLHPDFCIRTIHSKKSCGKVCTVTGKVNRENRVFSENILKKTGKGAGLKLHIRNFMLYHP